MGFPVVIVATVGNEAEIALKWEINCRLKMKYFVKLQQGIRKKRDKPLDKQLSRDHLKYSNQHAHQQEILHINSMS